MPKLSSAHMDVLDKYLADNQLHNYDVILSQGIYLLSIGSNHL